MKINRPQKAPSEPITNEELTIFQYPVFGSPKLDGFRCVTNMGAFTSSMKKIVNAHIQEVLSGIAYTGLDGELVVGDPRHPDAFNNTTGPVRRKDGLPNFKFYVFDVWAMPNEPYWKRLELLKDHCSNLPFVEVVEQVILNSPADVISYEAWCVEQGYEGAMIRSTTGLYKQGRCTLKELNIFKRKPVVDDEAVILGFEEQMQNNNETFENEMGLTTRSSHQENKTGKNTLGAFILKCKAFDEPFRCGTGLRLTEELRKKIWENQKSYLHEIVTFKYQKHGSIDAPRQPVFKGFRDKKDITSY